MMTSPAATGVMRAPTVDVIVALPLRGDLVEAIEVLSDRAEDIAPGHRVTGLPAEERDR